MRLNSRFAIPAALASLALAVPASTAVADPPPDHRSCPNNTDWVMWPAALSPQEKDRNEDGVVCKKADRILDDTPVKDNNNPPDDDDLFVDNEFLGVIDEILP